MNKKILLFIMLLNVIFISCENQTQDLEEIDELVLEGYLKAGLPISDFRVTKLIPFGSSDTLVTIDDAQIYIASGNETFLLQSIGDGYYENQDLIIEAGGIYELELEYLGKNISAKTFVPSKPTGVTLSENVIYRTKIEDFGDIQNQVIPEPTELTWVDVSGGNYYFVVVRNLESNPEVINSLFADNDFEFPEIITPPEITTSYFINQFSDITHYGTYGVEVFKVNPEYAELYQTDDANTNSLVEAATNIENAFGIFTGINSDTIYFEVKEL